MIGVWMSTKPASSISRRIAPTIRPRDPDVALHARAAQVEPAVAHAAALSSTLSSSSWKGSGVDAETISSSSTCTSISPVGIAGFTVSGVRRTTSPPRAEHELVADACASSAAAGACSGLITSWQMPVSSRRSTKTRPPWSRRVSRPAGERDGASRVAPRAARRTSRRASSQELLQMLDVADLDVELARAPEGPPVRGEDDCRARVLLAVAQLALERAPGVVGVGGEPRGAQLARRR